MVSYGTAAPNRLKSRMPRDGGSQTPKNTSGGSLLDSFVRHGIVHPLDPAWAPGTDPLHHSWLRPLGALLGQTDGGRAGPTVSLKNTFEFPFLHGTRNKPEQISRMDISKVEQGGFWAVVISGHRDGSFLSKTPGGHTPPLPVEGII